MPQGKRIDEQKVLELLRQPKRPSDQQIATQLGYAVETVRLRRYKFEEKGLIESQPAKRGRPRLHKGTQIVVKPSDAITRVNGDELDEIALRMFERCLEYPKLKETINRLDNQLAAAHNKIEVLEEDQKKQHMKQLRMEVAKGRQVIPGD